MPDPKDTSKTQRLKKILWESTLNAPIRGAYNLMNTPYEVLMGEDSPAKRKAVEDSFDAASGVTVGSAAAPKPRGAITMGANRNPRPARGVKSGSMRQQTLDSVKQGPKQPSTPAKDVKSGSMRQRALDDLKQGPKKPVKAADVEKGSTRATFLKKAGDPTASRKPRPGEKKFIGPQNKPAPGDKRFIGPMEKPKPGDKNFIGPRNKPAPGDKDFIGPTKSAAQKAAAPKRTFGGKMKAGAAAGAGLLGYASYRSADKPKAERKEAPRDDRASSKSDKAAAFKAKQQGMKTPGSPTNPNTKKPETKQTGDKSRLAKPEKKFSNFERMKQRQYEKEGFGGRSMTASKAKERVKSERGFKFKDLFKKK